MAASSLVDGCRFVPTLGGTTDWTYSSAVIGYNSPSLAGVVNGAQYSYHAESADKSQWEDGTGLYNTSTGVLTRATVLYNSSGTGTASGQSGAGTKISFTVAPQVAIVALKEDLVPQQVGQLPGTATNDSANSGNVGEYLTANLSVNTQVLMTGAVQNVTSMSIPAGDWDVWGIVYYTAGGDGSAAQMISGISSASATLPGNDSGMQAHNSTLANNLINSAAIPPSRVSLSASTTFFLVAQVSVGLVGNVSVWGRIYARVRR